MDRLTIQRESKQLAQQLGKGTEERAVHWLLEERKAKILARNYRCKLGELDLVFEEYDPESDEITLVFTEVKARSPDCELEGLEVLSWQQSQRIRKTAEYFLAKYSGRASNTRFDFLLLFNNEWKYFPNYLAL